MSKWAGRAVFTDKSGETVPKDLVKRIKETQYEPEPTKEQYFHGPLEPNYRRTEFVQQQQQPIFQHEDEYTEEGKRRKAADEEVDRLEKEYKLFKTEEEKTPGWADNVLKLISQPAQAALLQAINSGDLHRVAFAWKQVQEELENKPRHPWEDLAHGTRIKGVKLRKKLAEAKIQKEHLASEQRKRQDKRAQQTKRGKK